MDKTPKKTKDSKAVIETTTPEKVNKPSKSTTPAKSATTPAKTATTPAKSAATPAKTAATPAKAATTTPAKTATTTPSKQTTTPAKTATATPAKTATTTPSKPATTTPAKDTKKTKTTTTTPAKDTKKTTTKDITTTEAPTTKSVEKKTTTTPQQQKKQTPQKKEQTKQPQQKRKNTESESNDAEENNKVVQSEKVTKKQRVEKKTTTAPAAPFVAKEAVPELTPTPTQAPAPAPVSSGMSIFDALRKQQGDEQQASGNNKAVMDSFSTTNAFEAPAPAETTEAPTAPRLNSVGKQTVTEEEKEARKQKDQEIRDESNPRTVFVANVDLSSNPKELKALFGKYGKVEHVRFRSLPVNKEGANRKATYINKEYHDKRDTCNAYVVFEKESDAKKALAMNGTLFRERHLRLDIAANKHEKGKDENTVFVGGIPFELENEELHNVFEETIGDVENVRIIRDKHTGMGKGFAYVLFKKTIGARRAIEKKEMEVNGRTIRIFPNKEKPKGKNVANENDKKKPRHVVPRTRKANKSAISKPFVKPTSKPKSK
ncbi:hypothetical protein SAMD00019534_102920 [Acytostelium subglobosum LB1]|uniref:hypothetical protein n=1 Tax=Acytostelium subglobosum LB1 TaxID=1410327 RepID=UPI00064500A3|nr:hypothetical protein SAMD00019534_102920 [Acytostelium subglobosum LB1]GAM27117.1 hypothetical protein SAMD00019534_102920 [Acytostelium subglobosum LB1]|eukprot:XP_012749997.1 hypothetical protein SAMD00019534_102920 [Acytostelium subglobosum LB1]